MAKCDICANHEQKLQVVPCVACKRVACPICRGDEGDGYWNHQGKKGYACGECITASRAYEGGAFAVGREIKAHVHAVLLPEVLAAVDLKLDRVRDEIVPPIVKDALDRVELLTVRTLREAESTTERLVTRLEAAIGNQRVEVKTDVTEIVTAIERTLRRTLIWVAVIIGLVNAAGIVAAVLVARALAH